MPTSHIGKLQERINSIEAAVLALRVQFNGFAPVHRRLAQTSHNESDAQRFIEVAKTFLEPNLYQHIWNIVNNQKEL